MFKVVKKFTDLRDGNHVYEVGDEYPREGLKVTKERIVELSTNKNQQLTPLIEEVKEEPKPKAKAKAKAKAKK